jgi:peptide/nickel transport system substrate-binding protein
MTNKARTSRPISRSKLACIITSAALMLAPLLLTTGHALAAGAPLKPFVWARSSDALTLDPHAVNEGTTHALNHHIYETLISRDRTGKLKPALATSWAQTTNPLVWEFTLRDNVSFHDGQPFTAQDVLFSMNRALAPTSDLRTRLQGVDSFRITASSKIQITTRVRDSLLPIRLTDIFIMNKAWAEAHDVTEPQAYQAGEETYATQNANGTGPFRLLSREPGKATKLARNEKYWGWEGVDLSTRIAELIYRPIPDAQQRIDALLNGTVDFIQDVPLSKLEILRQAPAIMLKSGPENRVIFFGLSIKPEINGKANPLAKLEVRKAISIAIDRFAIQKQAMLGQSIPTGVLAPPGINGFPIDLDQIPPHDLDKARALLKAASVPDGANLTLDCPNNRYVNPVAICKSVAAQLAEIGLKVTVKLRTKGPHFQTVRAGQSQFYLLGWGVPTFDSAYIFTNLFNTRGPKLGTWNGTGFSDKVLDQKIIALSQFTQSTERARSMADIWQTARENMIYISIHQQTLLYAMRSGVNIEVDISNAAKLKNAIVTPAAADTKEN